MQRTRTKGLSENGDKHAVKVTNKRDEVGCALEGVACLL